ncbi:MAG: DNA primase [Bdellovibrionales bacterium]|nr:DNA primase [Bdellovibrionales bacterium]
MIPKEVIEDIQQRSDIVKVVGEVVSLKKMGKDQSGLCPFHQEKSPSFTVSSQKQLFYCFGCGEGGTVITFLMKFYHLSFVEALKRLALPLGIDLEDYFKDSEAAQKQNQHRKELYSLMQYVAQLFHKVLKHSESANGARKYLHERGFSKESIEKNWMGYVPEGWEQLSTALKKDGKNLDQAVSLGLLSKKSHKNQYFDVFRHRVIVPIFDEKDRVIGLGGRSLSDKGPKYLNSSQSMLFDKSRTLFGLNLAAHHLRKEKYMVIVEGYMDQMMLSQYGIENCVATLGTSLTQGHAQLLKRYTDRVVMLYDGDEAGRRAVRRSMKPLLEQGLDARVCLLPEGEDPDSFVRKNGKDELKRRLGQASGMIEFYFAHFYKNEKDLHKKAQYFSDLVQWIGSIKNVFIKKVLMDAVLVTFSVEKSVFQQAEPSHKSFDQSAIQKKQKSQKIQNTYALEEAMVLRVCAELPKMRNRFVEESIVELFEYPPIQEHCLSWLDLISEHSDQKNVVSAHQAVELWPHDESRSLVSKVFMEDWAQESYVLEKIWTDCISKLQERKVRQLRAQLEDAEMHGNQTALEKLSVQMQALKRKQLRRDQNGSGTKSGGQNERK